MYNLRKFLAFILLMIESVFKILTIAMAPKDLKQEFKEAMENPELDK